MNKIIIKKKKRGIDKNSIVIFLKRDTLLLEKVDTDEIKATISNKSLPNVVDQLTLECINRKTSIFYQIKEKSYFILKWFINWLCFWNYFQNIMFRLKNPFQSSCKLNIHTYIS